MLGTLPSTNIPEAGADPGAIRVSPFVLTWPRLLGIALPELAHAAALPLSKLEGHDDLSYDETIRLWDALETITGDPAVGLHAGARFSLDQMGVVGPALAHSTHLDAALDVLVRIMNVFVRNAGIRRLDADDGAGIAYRAPTLRSPHGIDTMFAATIALVRHCTGAQLVPLRVCHQLPRRAEHAYQRFYGVVPRWSADESQLWFRKGDLALPFRGASPQLAALLSEHAPRLLARESWSSSFDQDFEGAFFRAHHGGEATLESVAEALGVSARTLQRRLAATETTFAQKRASILHHRALQLLSDDSLSIEQIAERLGYSSRTAFERAFFRWSGQTPHGVRSAKR